MVAGTRYAYNVIRVDIGLIRIGVYTYVAYKRCRTTVIQLRNYRPAPPRRQRAFKLKLKSMEEEMETIA